MIIKSGLIYDVKQGFKKNDLLITNGKIVKIGREIAGNVDEIVDADGFYVIPGFIDLHTHGSYGFDTMTATCEELDKMSLFYASKGVTGYLPTTITAPVTKIVRALENIGKRIEMGTSGAKILGVNLEGPYVNNKFKGAHPEEYIMYPTVGFTQELIKKSRNNIRMITLAPELDGVNELVEYFKHDNIVFAIGHSALNSNGAQQIFSQGITHVTHLFNAMVGIHHREPGLAGAALDNDSATVEIIADGIHINPSIIRLVVKCKFPEKIALVTDSTMAAGLDDGEYFLGEQKVYVKSKVGRLSSGVLSGSTLTMIDAVRNMVNKFKIPIEHVIKMASYTPSKIINLNHKKGSIDIGKDADVVLLDGELNVKMTIVEGRVVFKG